MIRKMAITRTSSATIIKDGDQPRTAEGAATIKDGDHPTVAMCRHDQRWGRTAGRVFSRLGGRTTEMAGKINTEECAELAVKLAAVNKTLEFSLQKLNESEKVMKKSIQCQEYLNQGLSESYIMSSFPLKAGRVLHLKLSGHAKGNKTRRQLHLSQEVSMHIGQPASSPIPVTVDIVRKLQYWYEMHINQALSVCENTVSSHT
ncbi:uncharacterized protein LOC132823894 [Hemiscyllium ocellatum]|uniref:uncharacterized protein LOC132823894 n=1 Tax=Hemiscyllium ocellatum TaxID=170820 RepID=UPI002966BEE4|nr:uncharacterized protein LOC132823894 [Hemiscyllium ocellatum]